MKKLLLLALAALLATPAFAYVRPEYRDLKLPTQQMIEKQSFANLAASNSTDLLSASAGPTSAAVTEVSTFLAQPDVARILRMVPGGSTGDVASGCVVTITGTDILNNVISEDFTFVANQTTALDGLKAFQSVTNVSFAANCEDAPYQASWFLGVGESIGVKRCMDSPGHILFSTLAGAKESTAPTMSADESVVSLNKADFNGTMNGSNDFELFFIQNFQCVR